jgi:uncharacterized membrane protein YhaH (DUF805 family)
MDYYMAVLQKYADFSGRARRAEFWMFTLINILISIGIAIVEAIIGTAGAVGGSGIIGTIYSLAVFIPSIAVSARRLHDTNRSGWWLLIAFIPIVGWIALIIFYIQDSTPGENRYGPNPKGEPGLATA